MNSASTLPVASAPFQAGVLAIIGVGLIGGSVAAALRQHSAVDRVLGVGREPRSLDRARQLGLIDEAVSLQQAAGQADLILVATPVGAIAPILAGLRPWLRPGTLVTDVGSTKADVVAAARIALGDKVAQFIPAHPIAGAEKTGPDAANGALYQGRTVVLTPLAENSRESRHILTRMWERCGARVITMAPDVHDTVLASVSHVPHFLSSVFMGQVAATHDSDTRLSLAGTGFRDFTRIAAGSAEVWRDILLSNRPAILAELKAFRDALEQAERSLQQEDAQGLHDFLERAALARRFWGSRSGLS
jgi:prephenate dehydrogenase